MNLKNLSDDQLLEKTQTLVRHEREVTGEILHHLREIEARRLYSSLKLSSLFDYATKVLGYSEDEAYRRISAMRLLKELPEVEEKINSGVLKLSQLTMAQSHFKNESRSQRRPIAKEEKLEILNQLESKSARETQRVLASHSTIAESPKESIRAISVDKIEIKLVTTRQVEEKINELKGLLAHKYPNLTLGELMDKLCDLGLANIKRQAKTKTVSENPTCTSRDAVLPAISHAATLRILRVRARYRCENCKSQFALEIDHIKPKALGGGDEPQNLRLLCRTCNQRAAILSFGKNKMNNYLEPQQKA